MGGACCGGHYDPEKEQGVLRVGDAVFLNEFNQSGTIIAYERGRWKVRTETGRELLIDGMNIQHRQILHG